MASFFRFRVFGEVQGVGFRPHVFREAQKRGLSGFVRNAGSHAEIVADRKEDVFEILEVLPKNAKVSGTDVKEISGDYKRFQILESEPESSVFASGIPADTATCSECLKELHESKNARHKYFFITCTSCGPRFTIADSYPYDRRNTSMNEFAMCDACKKEYKSPQNRRFHAETIACERCGPSLSLYAGKKKLESKGPVKDAAGMLVDGKIVSIKGIGGYHLACLAREETVAGLRKLTSRPDKPFAVMVRDIGMARKIAHVSEDEKKLLESSARPIVLLKATGNLAVSELDTVGVMLPYTALHNLLFDHIDEPIVMTSANLPDEPVTSEFSEQFSCNVLEHDRRIARRADDSVVKPVAGKALIIRRSRGFVPNPIGLDVPAPILAIGGDSMNTFCLAKGGNAVVSQHIGSLENPKTFAHCKSEVEKFLAFYNFRPEVVLCDMHPGYYSSAYAKELSGKFSARLIPVQHHIAHAASCAAEHGVSDYAAVVCDGSGYGLDGNVWGGEIIVNGKREGHLEEHAMPGKEYAITYPKKMLFGVLSKFMGAGEISKVSGIAPEDCRVLERQVAENFNCAHTTSAGRVLDAASALLGFCEKRTYDARPAMLLEANSSKPYDVAPQIKGNVLLTTPLFEYLVQNTSKDRKRLAATAQQYLAEGLYLMAKAHKKQVLFSGGCAYNRIMAEYFLSRGAFVNEKVPAGDGGLSFGQAAFYASKMHETGKV